MRVLGYRGVSIGSIIIKFQTRADHSHVAIQLTNGEVIEAWQTAGVRRISNPYVGHSKNTVIDVYRIAADFDEEMVRQYLIKCIGQKYDWANVWRFIPRRKAINNNKKFCSELVELALKAGGCKLLRGNPSEHSPRDTLLSPHLVFEKTI